MLTMCMLLWFSVHVAQNHSSMHVTVTDLLIYKEAVGLSILLCQTPACLCGL